MINDAALPEEQDWAVMQVDGCTHVVVKRSKWPQVTAEVEAALDELVARTRAA